MNLKHTFVILSLTLVLATHKSLAQPSESDVLYVSDWAICYGTLGSCTNTDDSRTNVEGDWEQVFNVFDPPQNQSQGQRDFTIGVRTAGATALYTTRSYLRQRVRTPFLVGGLLHGGGHTTSVKVFVRGEPGTPYSLTTSYNGFLQVEGAGSLGTNAFFLTANLGTNDRVPLVRGQVTTNGVTSNERHPSRPTYTLAAVVPITFYSSSDYLFGNFDIVVSAEVTYQIFAARIGCIGGTIDIRECSPLRQRNGCPGGFPSYSAGIAEEVQFLGDCRCCEYRRRVETWTRTNYFNEGHALEREDGGSDCSGNHTRHGYRSDPDQRNAPVDSCSGRFDVYEPDRMTGCRYYGEDAPGPSSGRTGFENWFWGLRYEAFFTGQIVETAACAGGTERVVQERRWTVCIEFDWRGNPVPCSSRRVQPFRTPSPTPATVGGVPVRVTASRIGGRLALGAELGSSSSTGAPDIELSATGFSPIPVPGGGPSTIVVTDPSRGFALGGAVLEPSGTWPNALLVTVRLGSDTATLDVAGTSLGLFCLADRNSDLGVTVDDLLDYLQSYVDGAREADLGFDGGVTIEDLLEYLDAYITGC